MRSSATSELPDLDGPALFAWLSQHKPHLCECTAFVTGDTLGAAASSFLVRAGRPTLEKPFVPAELRRLMAELMPSAAKGRRDAAPPA